MSSTSSLTRIALLFMLSSVTSLASAAWEQVTVNDSLLNDLFVGENDRPSPSCSEGPQLIPQANNGFKIVKTSPEFSFFVERGSGENFAGNLLLYLSGGGACWDAATCVGSALTPFSSYFTTILDTAAGLEAASGDPAGGILATLPDNPNLNPYAGFAKV